jgi:CheY-like chemotaxis protein
MRVQTPYSQIETLVIDDMAAQVTTLRGLLGMLGIGKSDQASNATEALRLIKAKRYGLILCDYNLNSKTDGQQLFEHLRDQQLLAPDCLFFMVTAESGYNSVAAANEHKPDAYLLKPITAGDIEQRLKSSMERRQVLQPVHALLAKHELAGAVLECDKLLASRGRWTMQVLQMKGQTLLDMGRHEDAKLVYLDALEQRSDLIWAQLGMARACKAAGEYDQARHYANEIIQSKEGEKNLAAYDVMAEALEAQGDCAAAMWVLKDSAQVVPSPRRQRLVAETAYRLGDLETAKECYAKVAKASRGSLNSQPQDTLALAQAMVDNGEAREALAVLDAADDKALTSPQYENVAMAVRAQALARAGDLEGARKAATRARETTRQFKADFATIAIAKAELLSGREAEGLKLLEAAVSADHENTRVRQWVGNALNDTGHADKLEQVVEGTAAGLKAKVNDAKALFRNSRIEEALTQIELALKEFPDNTGVLFQAAQMTCMSLRLNKKLNGVAVERVRQYLARLDKLMPGNDRVAKMRRYFRETMSSIAEPAAEPAASA